jgi:hypothetical protein
MDINSEILEPSSQTGYNAQPSQQTDSWFGAGGRELAAKIMAHRNMGGGFQPSGGFGPAAIVNGTDLMTGRNMGGSMGGGFHHMGNMGFQPGGGMGGGFQPSDGMSGGSQSGNFIGDAELAALALRQGGGMSGSLQPGGGMSGSLQPGGGMSGSLQPGGGYQQGGSGNFQGGVDYTPSASGTGSLLTGSGLTEFINNAKQNPAWQQSQLHACKPEPS